MLSTGNNLCYNGNRHYKWKRGDKMIDKDELWQGVANYLREILADAAYDNWVKDTYPLRLIDTKLSLSVPSDLIKKQWEDNLSGYITQYAMRHYGVEIHPIFMVNRTFSQESTPQHTTVQPSIVNETNLTFPQRETGLNAKYTFDTFVVSDNNKYVTAAALAICDSPGTAYNPFLIYGGVGLGKTHLMQAIGNEIKRRNPNTRIKYVTTETFTNDFVNSIQDREAAQFKKELTNQKNVLIRLRKPWTFLRVRFFGW